MKDNLKGILGILLGVLGIVLAIFFITISLIGIVDPSILPDGLQRLAIIGFIRG